MNVLRLILVFFRIGAMNEMAYRSNFWIQTFETLLNMSTALIAVFLVFRQTESLAGWGPWELLALLGIYFMMLGTINMVIAPSLTRFMGEVRMGQLDFTITKPADAQLLVSISEFQIWKLGEVFMGGLLLVVSLVQLAETVSIFEALQFALAMACGSAIVYSFWIILATLCFWFIRIENVMMIFWSMYVAGRWPIGIYPPWLRWSLTALVPIVFAVSVPAQALTGRLSPRLLAVAVVLAVAFLFVSRRFWKLGLRHYSGASA